MYKPPFTITPEIISLLAEICELLGRMSALQNPQELRLRRINRIKTVHGSVAIEGNTLTEDQISDILDGKQIVAPLREVQEVRNAIKAYDQYEDWDPVDEDDLLKAHAIMTAGLLDNPGNYRCKAAGIMGGEDIVHIAPPAERVSFLIKDLLAWLRDTDMHPLIASSVFHYEFEFIHPFEDGNGRIGRLWQTLILTRWNPLFADIPIESMVHVNQQAYYYALNQSTNQANCTPFIEFMLNKILDAINTPQVKPQVTPQVNKLLAVIKNEMSRQEILDALNLKDRKSLTKLYIRPAIEAGLLKMTVPNKPNSKLQKYILTAKGQKLSKGN